MRNYIFQTFITTKLQWGMNNSVKPKIFKIWTLCERRGTLLENCLTLSLKLCIYLKGVYTPLYWYVKSALMNSIHELTIYWNHKTVLKKIWIHYLLFFIFSCPKHTILRLSWTLNGHKHIKDLSHKSHSHQHFQIICEHWNEAFCIFLQLLLALVVISHLLIWEIWFQGAG